MNFFRFGGATYQQVAQLQGTANLIFQQNSQILAALKTSTAQGAIVMIDVTQLTAKVAANTTVIGSALVVIQGFAATQASLAAQLKDAIAANDPVAMAAVQTAIDTSAQTLQDNDTLLANAVAANTVAAPPPPGGGAPSSQQPAS